MMYPISNQQKFFLKKIIIIYQTNKEKQTNENKLIGRIIKMDRLTEEESCDVNLLPSP